MLYFKIVNTIIFKASQAQVSLHYNMTVLVFTVVLYLTAFTVKAQDCTALANAGNCGFYAQCAETKFQCGTNGYPLAYGDRYCRRFENKQNCFTSAVSIKCFYI